MRRLIFSSTNASVQSVCEFQRVKMFFQFFVYVLFPSFLVFYFWAKQKLNTLQSKGILCLEPSFPLGNMKDVGKKVHLVERNQEIYEAFKSKDKLAGFYMMLKPSLLLIDLDLIKQVLVKDFNKFVNRGVYYNEDGDPVSAHMFAIEDSEWKFIRTKLSPTFTTGKIKNMFQTVINTSNSLVDVIDSGKQYEIRNLCNRYICDIIGNVAFGIECNALKDENSQLLVVGDKLFSMKEFQDFFRFFFCNSFIDFSRKLNLRLMKREYSDYFVETLREAIKYREDNNIKRQDFLNSLIQLKNTGTTDGEKIENDKKLSFDQIAAEAFIFFFAGV
jgi:cytochrome P450 family 6